ASGNTPTMESYSEVARYMLGMSPTNYAKEGPAKQNSPAPAINMSRECTRYSNGTCKTWSDWTSASSYTSPINMNNQCESNHIIVMTDGAPTSDGDYSSISDITGSACATGSFSETKSYTCQQS